jgi:hypothetical protein
MSDIFWTGAQATSGATAMVVPRTITVAGPAPDPALHHEAKIGLAPHPGYAPAWNGRDHLGLPIEGLLFAGSALAVAAWHHRRARFKAFTPLV